MQTTTCLLALAFAGAITLRGQDSPLTPPPRGEPPTRMRNMAVEPRGEIRAEGNVAPRWPIATPFNELAARIVAGKATADDKAEFRKLATALKESGRGPWWDRVRVAESTDGLNFTDLKVTVLEKASVPEAVVDHDGNVWLFFVDGDLDKWVERVETGGPFETGLMSMGAAKSADGIHFERVPMEIKNVNAGKNVDPDIVATADGTYHLYYLGVPASELAADTADPARASGPHRFFLATSRDLIHWEQQGVAWTGPHGGADPAVYRDAKDWFILGGGAGRSDDGGKTFQPIQMTTGRWGQPDVIAVEGGFRLFCSTLNGILSAFSKDGVSWTDEEGVRARGGADPSVVRMKDGSWRMYYKVGGRQPLAPQFSRSAGGLPAASDRAAVPPALQRRDGNPTGTMPPGDGGPRNHRILLASSKDGLNWNVSNESLAEQASVPEVFEGPNGKLTALFVDASGQSPRGALGALVRGHDGKWARVETNLRGADPNVVRLKDGTYRGYTKDRDGAIIVFSSRDGLDWEQLGVAFQDERYRHSTDSDVFETPDGWVMLISLGPRMLRCMSSEGLKFTTDSTILELGGSVSDTVKVQGGWRTFFHVNATPHTGGKMLIRSAFTTDGKTWKVEEGDRVVAPASGPASLGVADPAPVQLKDGSWLMAIKSFIERGGAQFGRSAGSMPARSFEEQGERGNQEFQPPQFAAAGQDQRPRNPQPPGGGGSTPREHEVHSATSKDGLTWTRDEGIRLKSASVPCVINDGDKRILLYVVRPPDEPGGVGGVSCAVSTDGTNFQIEKQFRIEGLSTLTAADPSIMKDADGKFRLYYLASNHRGDPAHGENPHKINYALSDDGLRFREIGTAFTHDDLVDPDVFRFKGQWFMYVFARGTLIATSPDGKSFTYNKVMSPPGWGTVAPLALADGRLRLYAFDQRTPIGNTVRSFISTDGLNWTTEPGDRLKANADEQITDPFVIPWRGGYKMYFKHLPARRGGGGVPAPAGQSFDNPQRPARNDARAPESETRKSASQAPNNFNPQPPPQNFGASGQIRVEKIDSKYKAAPGAKPGAFVTGQDADLMLAGFGFNDTGGALHFNHPTGLATDGRALLMTDRWNNRVLIWKSAPAGNTPPDLVLGQPDFTQNNPGTGKHQMNWPGNVTITPDGTRVAVTDTNNDRILIWNSFPTKNGVAADVVLELESLSRGNEQQPRLEPGDPRPRFGGGMRFGWPWGVWTDGRKFAVVATHGSAVLIWNSVPARDNQPPDLILRPGDAGTPRNVTSDGNWFAVSDHNNGEQSRPATMVWRTFPTNSTQPPDFKWSEWMKGSFTRDGGLVAGGMSKIYVWKKTPQNAETDADVVLRPSSYRNGDGPDAVMANGRFYACSYNGNMLLGWNSLPARDEQPPDFSVGSDTPGRDVWAENFFIQNGVVATDGKSLFVSSDFNRTMFVWRNLPDENAAKPDLVFHLPEAPWDNELHGSTLVLAGKSTVYIWRKLPLDGEPPDATLSGNIGSVRLGEITGVAFDEKYFYLSDRRAESIYVWEGIPTRDSEPKFMLAMRSPGRLNSDGKYLCAAPFEGAGINLWRVSDLGSRAEPITLGGRGQFNLPSECLIADGRMFVVNRSFNHVDVWNRVEDALAGRPADALLGARDEQDRQPEIGRNQLFGPGSVAWGGGYLWVSEFKFSTRILRFSPQAIGTRSSR